MTGTPPSRGTPSLGDADLALVRTAFDEGARRAPGVALSFDAFLARVLEVAERECEAQGEGATPDAIRAYLHRAELADLHLATACDLGDARAWEAVSTAVRGRLEAFVVRRVGSAADAEMLVQDLLGDLAAPPPRRNARTLLGTFGATGTLLGWLSIVLLRRVQARARRKKAASLDGQPVGVREAALPRRPETQPLAAGEAAQSSEAVRIFSDAFDRAWPTLTAQERLVLTLKHRNDWSQRRIAGALGVGEARVSRIVSAAVEGLSKAVDAAAAAFAGDRSDALRAVFAGVVADRLASSGAETALPGDETVFGDDDGSRSRTATRPADGDSP